jgi:hypothetical protein
VVLLLCVFAAVAPLPAQKKKQHRATPPGGANVEMAIDGTNETTFAASVESIAKTLRGAQRDQFVDGLQLLETMAPSREALLGQLDGMGPKELVRIHGEIVSRGDTDGDGVLSAAERERLRAEVTAQRREANERSAIATLRNFCVAQEQIRAGACIDGDGDGRGEYAYVAEMTAAIGLRNRAGRHGKVPIETPVLPTSYEVRDGCVLRSGYVFRLYLPAADGSPVGETGNGGMGKPAPDANVAARAWCAYAWPRVHGESGVRAFFVCEDGVVLESPQATYSTPERGPSADAALPQGVHTLGTDTGGKERIGNDGALWRPVK